MRKISTFVFGLITKSAHQDGCARSVPTTCITLFCGDVTTMWSQSLVLEIITRVHALANGESGKFICLHAHQPKPKQHDTAETQAEVTASAEVITTRA